MWPLKQMEIYVRLFAYIYEVCRVCKHTYLYGVEIIYVLSIVQIYV